MPIIDSFDGFLANEEFPVEVPFRFLNEDGFTLHADGKIVFDSGVEYTFEEWKEVFNVFSYIHSVVEENCQA